MPQDRSYSQISQDIFVLNFFGRKASYFLDLGCGDGNSYPCGNNTLLLEQNGWDGLSIDIDSNAVNSFNATRKTKALAFDLANSDLKKILDENQCPKVIDYLSFDVDEVSETVLAKLPLNDYVFRFVTFEHNAYIPNQYYRTLKANANKILSESGYQILIDNVILENHGAVEDWYVHAESTVDLTKKVLTNINHRQVLEEYQFL